MCLFADRSKWRVLKCALSLPSAVWCGFLFGVISILSPLETDCIPVLVIDTAWNCVCSIILIWLQNYSHGAQALWEQELTQWLGLGLSVFLIGLCEYLDWPKSLVLCLSWKVLFFSFPQYKGIIIPIYFSVLQSWHPETRHGDKTWTAGPRKSCSLFCHHHLLFNPFLCNAHLFFQYTMIYIYMYINKTNIFTEFSYCKHCRVSVWNVK